VEVTDVTAEVTTDGEGGGVNAMVPEPAVS
jgi:hypothetical protein